jgi:hypothetical protein
VATHPRRIPESLEAVYLREAAFAKAPRPREVTAL